MSMARSVSLRGSKPFSSIRRLPMYSLRGVFGGRALSEPQLVFLISLSTLVTCAIIAFNIRDHRGRNVMLLAIDYLVEQVRHLRVAFSPAPPESGSPEKSSPNCALAVCPRCGHLKFEFKNFCWQCGFDTTTASVENDLDAKGRTRCPQCGEWKQPNRPCQYCD
jgi:ribosomal protein L32